MKTTYAFRSKSLPSGVVVTVLGMMSASCTFDHNELRARSEGIDGSIDGGIDASVGGNDGVDRVDSPAVYDTGAMDVENDYPTITCPSTTAGVEILCGGLCINPATDMTYCGASFGCGESGMGSAGTPCPGDSICNAGRCSTRCGVNSTACVALDGGYPYCANTQTDNANCGACGNVCGDGTACLNGVCAVTCGASATLCSLDGGSGYCANLQTDNNDCGSCGNQCVAGGTGVSTCRNGTCVWQDVTFSSLIFPNSNALGWTVPRPVTFGIATASAATIYYTTDGSTPSKGATATTAVTASTGPTYAFVTVPGTAGVASQTLSWYADFGTSREAVRSIAVVVNGDYSHWGGIFDNFRLNGAGPIAVVSKGAALTGTCHETVWNGSSGTSSAILTTDVGLDGVSVSKDGPWVDCIMGTGGSSGPTEVASRAFSFKAPSQSGMYFFRQRTAADYQCNYATDAASVGNVPVGLVVVN